MPTITTLETELDRTIVISYNRGPDDYFLQTGNTSDPASFRTVLLSPEEAARLSAALVSKEPLPEPPRPLAVGDVMHRGGFTRTIVWVSEAGDLAIAVDSNDNQVTSYGRTAPYTIEDGLAQRARAERSVR